MNEKSTATFSQRQKIVTTVGIYFGNICLAIGMNVYSPTVTEFEKIYGVKVEEVSVVFTILTISYMVGALLTSFIYNFLNRQLGVVFGLVGISVSLYLTPLCPTIFTLYAVAVLLGLCNGLYNASQVVWVIEMWQPNTGPFIQGQHFFYAVGSLIPSLLVGPFLAPESADTTLNTPIENSSIWIPFTIAGILGTIAAIAQLYFFIFQRYTPPPPVQLPEKVGSIETPFKEIESQKVIDPKYLKIYLIVLSAVFLGFYQGMEMVTMQFIATFAQYGEQGLSPAEGAQVMTALTGSFAVARGFGILANMKIPAIFILAFNLIVLFVSCGVLIPFGGSVVGLWTGVILLGIGFSTIYPSFCAYIERHLLFTNFIGSTMLVSGSLVASIFPFVIGGQIDENAMVLIYVNLFCTILITLALLVIFRFTFRRSPVKL